MADVPHPPKVDYPPSIDWEGVNESLGMSAKTEPLDEKLYAYGDFGLAPLKTEGERFVYDPGAGPPMQLTRWQRWALRWEALGDRLRWLPNRLWWALFGDGDY